jgi:phosphoribosylformylglycinamidine (FGAM) synthase PurS component
MKDTIIILVQLKTKDAVAETAFQCLTGDMVYKDTLIKMKRSDFWAIELHPHAQSDLDTLAKHLATETKLFVNPNKHTFTLHHSGDIHLDTRPCTPDCYPVNLLVRDRVDTRGTAALNHLHTLYGLNNQIKMVHSGNLWMLDIRAKDSDAATAVANDLACTKNRQNGLLANLQSQTVSLGLTNI